jgi:hypothetical protein
MRQAEHAQRHFLSTILTFEHVLHYLELSMRKHVSAILLNYGLKLRMLGHVLPNYTQ